MYIHGSPQPLLLSDVLCGDVSHSAECFYYGLPPLLTSVGNKILVPGVVERLWIWRPLLQRANYSFPILLLVVPQGLCSSTCVKGSWFWNKYYYTTETGSSISTLPLESQGSASAFPEERPAAGLVVQPKCVIQSNYLIQFLVVGCKRSDFWRNTTLCSDLEQRQRGASLTFISSNSQLQ